MRIARLYLVALALIQPGCAGDAAPVNEGEPDAAPAAQTATLRGVVTASAQPANGGVGALYVAVTDRSPIMGDAEPVAGIVIESADFSVEGAAVAYELVVPVAEMAVYVTAFLDDNGNAETVDPPGPDMGDLMSLDGLDPPSIVVASPGDYTLDLDLNFAFPF